jgi:hypothetical protein
MISSTGANPCVVCPARDFPIPTFNASNIAQWRIPYDVTFKLHHILHSGFDTPPDTRSYRALWSTRSAQRRGITGKRTPCLTNSRWQKEEKERRGQDSNLGMISWCLEHEGVLRLTCAPKGIRFQVLRNNHSATTPGVLVDIERFILPWIYSRSTITEG